MSRIENKLKELNITLPEPKAPVGAYVASKIVGNLLFISGQISIDENKNLIKGKIGEDLSLNQGYQAASRCGLSLLAHAKKACNEDLDKIKSCVKLTGYVNSSDDFIEQLLPNFVSYWLDRGQTHFSWGNVFLKYAIREWRAHQNRHGIAEHGADMSSDWCPS